MIVKGSTSVCVDPRGAAHAMRQTIARTFSVPDMGWTIRLKRNPSGIVTGFSASIARPPISLSNCRQNDKRDGGRLVLFDHPRWSSARGADTCGATVLFKPIGS